MINFFTGRPGNGKSLHMAMIIYKEMKKGKNVIANFEINESIFEKFDRKHPGKRGTFIYVPNSCFLNNSYKPVLDKKGQFRQPPKDMYSYIEGIYGYAEQFHERNYKGQIIENQTLLVLDECQELFNSRSWNRKDRIEWCSFFRQHRKYGYEVYLISQDDGVIDKQIRSILQYEFEHRCINNYKFFGRFLAFMFTGYPSGKLFVCVKRMYGVKKTNAKVKSTLFTGQYKFYDFYDSYKTFTRGTIYDTPDHTDSTQKDEARNVSRSIEDIKESAEPLRSG